MYAAMPQCEKFILGGIQDNYYAHLLPKFETEDTAQRKLILLQPSPWVGELERVNSPLFPRVSFGNLFMQKRLEPGKRYAQVAAAELPSPISPRAPTSSYKTPSPIPQKLQEPELSITLRNKLTKVFGYRSRIYRLGPAICFISILSNAQNSTASIHTIIFCPLPCLTLCDIIARNNFVGLFNKMTSVRMVAIVFMDTSVLIVLAENVVLGRNVNSFIPVKSSIITS